MADNNLFSKDEEYVSLNEEEIPLEQEADDEAEEDEAAEGSLGGKNIFLLALLLILVVGVVVFMMLAMQKDDSGIILEDDSSAAVSDPVFSESSEPFVSEEVSEEVSENIEISIGDVSEETSLPEVSEEPGEENPDEEPFHGWIINNMGYTYLYYGVGVEQFNYSNKTLGKYTSSLASIADKIPEGTTLYCMPLPTRIGFLYGQISN